MVSARAERRYIVAESIRAAMRVIAEGGGRAQDRRFLTLPDDDGIVVFGGGRRTQVLMGEQDMLTIVTERFERRLAEEISGLRIEMHSGFAAIRKEIAEQRAELLKWSMLFWIGQFAAFTAVLSFMLRNR